jgi:curved DNA-binding protein CbpA
MPTTHYTTLGVSTSASRKEINQAYRRLAWLCHPDLQPPERRAWAEEQMKQLNEAYEVLSDPEVRVRYNAAIGFRPGTQPARTRKTPSRSLEEWLEKWYGGDPFHEFRRHTRYGKWRQRAASASLLLDTLLAAFLMAGAYLILVEWNAMFTNPLQAHEFSSQWTFAGIWYVVLVATFIRMIPRRR